MNVEPADPEEIDAYLMNARRLIYAVIDSGELDDRDYNRLKQATHICRNVQEDRDDG